MLEALAGIDTPRSVELALRVADAFRSPARQRDSREELSWWLRLYVGRLADISPAEAFRLADRLDDANLNVAIVKSLWTSHPEMFEETRDHFKGKLTPLESAHTLAEWGRAYKATKGDIHAQVGMALGDVEASLALAQTLEGPSRGKAISILEEMSERRYPFSDIHYVGSEFDSRAEIAVTMGAFDMEKGLEMADQVPVKHVRAGALVRLAKMMRLAGENSREKG